MDEHEWIMKHQANGRTNSGFSLMEVLLVTVMMAIIIYGLYSMFNQTQKSFRSNNAQVDVMNAARSVMDNIARDVELLSACDVANGANFLTLLSYPYGYPSSSYNRNAPVIQATVPGDLTDGPFRTNFMQNMFFLQKQSNYWMPCGYFLGEIAIQTNGTATNAVFQVSSNGVGSLYRMNFVLTNEFGERAPSREYKTNFSMAWLSQFIGHDAGATRGYYHTNASLLAEGVVHFAVRCFDSAGQYIQHTNYYRPNQTNWDREYRDSSGIWRTNLAPQADFNIYAPNPNLTMNELIEDCLDNEGMWRVGNELFFPTNVPATSLATNLVILGEAIGSGSQMIVTDNLFMSNAIPSYIEIEIGLLEPSAHEKLNAIGSIEARRQFLLRNAGKVHLFRKQIPIRMAFQ